MEPCLLKVKRLHTNIIATQFKAVGGGDFKNLMIRQYWWV
jgi:hypothetical protein